MNEIPLSTLYLILFVLLCLSGFFSSSETGLMAVNRYRMRHLANNGHRAARMTQRLLRKPDRLIGLILLGNNLVNILAASIATVIGIRLFGDSGVWIASLALTVVILIFAEVAPKTMAALHPERIAFPASFVLAVLLKVFYPLVWLINGVTNLLLRPFGIRTRAEVIERLNREELRTLLQEGGQISNEHQRMLVNILDLEHATVDDVMIPRHDIVGIDLDDDWETVLNDLTQTLYTRMPVFRDSIDNVEGLLHIRTVIAKLTEGGLTFGDLKRSIRSPYFIPEGTNLMQQLLEFQSRERRMGLVVDEYGDIQGMVTLDDILEEIVGEYTTEGKERSRAIRHLDDDTHLVEGATSVRMLNRRMNWDLPEEEANTINGLLLEVLEVIPDGKTCVRIGSHEMTIVEINDNVIGKVMVRTRQSG
ncbi:HlyC/CorC family transporter [Elongatibacter sediminis]|uniref:HlyC/CorC family transporter n=1 Tax=Elongatibacter sediminis TaxID=3119006 RepID=A0AAW9RFI4_9GAMM